MTQNQEIPETPLPPVGANDVAAHGQMSVRFKEHTAIEMQKGNRLQTSEKIWASVAHSLKAVAKQRGWKHTSHSQLHDVARQLGRELGEERAKQFSSHFTQAEAMHKNLYENVRDWDVIAEARDDAQVFIGELDALRDAPPPPFTPREAADQRRLARLLGIETHGTREERAAQLDLLLPRKVSSPVGFSPNYGYRIPELGELEEDAGSNPAVPPRPGNPPPECGEVNPAPTSGSGVARHVALKPGQQIGPDKTDTRQPSEIWRRARRSKKRGGESTEVNIRFR